MNDAAPQPRSVASPPKTHQSRAKNSFERGFANTTGQKYTEAEPKDFRSNDFWSNDFWPNYAGYIGLAYHPVHFNCWHLVQRVQAECFGRRLPDFAVDPSDHRAVMQVFETAAERQRWRRINAPVHGCCVLMRRSKLASHIGVWLDTGGRSSQNDTGGRSSQNDTGGRSSQNQTGILHNLIGVGVVFQQPADLIGISIEGYYDHQ